MTSPTTVSISPKTDTAATNSEVLLPDQRQIQDFLQILGYRMGDTFYLRGFYPSDNPLKETDKGRKAETKDISHLVDIVTNWQKEGRGVYLVINGGGHTDAKVLNCRAIFYEHDDLDKELQTKLWAMMGLPQPSLQVDTGGKSIHSYWVFETPIAPEQWRQLQTDLLNFTEADRSLKNPSRVMRIPGCFHISAEGAKPSKIISASCKTYSFDKLRELIPNRQQKNTVPIQSAPGEIPLYQVLSKSDRQLIDSGAGRGERNTQGAKLARGIIGTAARMNSLGHRFSGIPREIFANYCDHCNPPLEDKEADLIWKSAERSNPTSTLSDEYLETCIKSWSEKNGHKSSEPKQENSPATKVSTKVSTKDKLLKAIDALIDDDLSRSEVEANIPEIALAVERSPSDVRRIYQERKKERDKAERRKDTLREIPSLLDAQKARLDPSKLFFGDGGFFAELLTRTADSMPTSVENLITTLIPALGSRIGTSGRIVIKPSARYTQPAIYWTCIVAPTGRLKTPAQQVILQPLVKLEAEEFKQWKLHKEDFEEELKSYRKSSAEEPPTAPPPRKRLIIQTATPETRIKIHAENPRGLLYYRDEWSAFINARNKYRGGKGDDLEQDLSEFNGDAIFKDNSNESCFLSNSSISRTGNTQPETLKRILSEQDFEDYTGEFARWLFCLVPAPVAYIDLFSDDGTGEVIENALMVIYKLVGKIPEQDYFLEPGAKKVFQDYHRFLTDAEVAEEHPGMRATYPKLKSYLARLALWLHVVNSVLAGDNPPQFIGASIMELSATMIDFYLAQSKILYGDTTGQQVTGDLLKVKDFMERNPEGITPRDVKQRIFSLRGTPTEEILGILTSLCDLGVCKTEGKKFIYLQKNINNINKTPKQILAKDSSVDQNINKRQQPSTKVEKESKIVDGVDDLLMVNINAETPIEKESQHFVDVVDVFSHHKKEVNKIPPVTKEKNDKNERTSVSKKYDTTIQEFKRGDRIRFLTDVNFGDIQNDAKKPDAKVALKGQIGEVCGVNDPNGRIAVSVGGEPFQWSQKLVEKIMDDCSTSTPWKPTVGGDALYVDEIVKIVGFENGGRKYQIEHKSGFMEYVKASALKQPNN